MSPEKHSPIHSWRMPIWILISIILGFPASAAVTPTGTVTTEGGDAVDDGLLPATAGDYIAPAGNSIVLADLAQLIIDGGSFVQADEITTPASGAADWTVTGSGTLVRTIGLGDRLTLNGGSSGQILAGAIYDGSDPAGCIFATCNVVVGGATGSDAQLLVSGAGSRLEATSAIIVGSARVLGTPIADATGTLVIADGGVVNGVRSAFGQGTFGDASGNAISRGFLEVRDAGSQFNVFEILMGNNPPSADFQAGEAGFLIEDQGTVNVETVVVAGAGTDTVANIDLLDGGVLNAQALYAARGVGSTSSIVVDGPTTQLNLGDELIIGQGSTGTLSLTNGATINIGGGAETGFIGSSITIGTQGGTGSAVFNNANVTIGANSSLPEVRLSVGLQGTGSLLIENGSTVVLEDLFGGLGQVGDAIGVGESGPGLPASGSLVVTGADTSLTLNTGDLGALVAGIATNGIDAAVGVIDILDGATVSVAGTGFNSGINLGRGANSQGTLNISGPGSTLDISGPQGVIVVAADFGNAIGDGDALFTATDQAVVNLAGLTPGQGYFNVGQGTGRGEVQVNTGATVNIDGFLNISFATADNNTQSGLVTVDDTGVINVDDVFLGLRGVLSGTGTVNAERLTVFSGGLVELVGVDGFNNILLDGGSYDLPAGDIDLSASEAQSIVVRNGGAFTAPGTLSIGASGLDSLLEVSGATSSFNADGDISIFDSVVLNAGGSLSTPGSVLIAGGGVLSGDGGNLVATSTLVDAGGTVGPGNSPGTLNIVGDLVLDGGTLDIEIAGNQPGEFDVINVDGAINLNAGTVGVTLLDGYNPGGQSFDVLTATGALDVGTGVTFLSNGPGPDFEFSVRNDGGINFGTVTFTAFDIATIETLSETQFRMATYLDDLCPRIEGLAIPSADQLDLDARCGSLRNAGTSTTQVAAALDVLTPDEIIGTFNSLLKHTQIQHGNLSRRLNGLRSGASRVDLSNLEIATDDVKVAGADLQAVLGELSQNNFGRWGFFSEGRINFGDRDDTRRTPGYDFNTVALTAGTDYRLRDNLYLGAAIGYNEVDADFDVGGGVEIASYSLSLLGTYFYEDLFYLDALVTYGHSNVDTSRQLTYSDSSGDINRSARGESDGTSFGVGVGTGLDFTRGRWVFGPHLGFSYSDTSVDAFNETGAGGLNLALPETVSRSVTANAGFHVSTTFAPRWGVVVPYAQVDYIKEFKNQSENEKVRFVSDTFAMASSDPSRPVIVETGGVDANYMVWSLGVHMQLIRGMATFIDYRRTAGLDHFDIGEVAVGFRYEKRI